MAENMFNSAHKTNSDEYKKGHKRTFKKGSPIICEVCKKQLPKYSYLAIYREELGMFEWYCSYECRVKGEENG